MKKTTQRNLLSELQQEINRAALTVFEKQQIRETILAQIQTPPEAAIAIILPKDNPSPAGTAS